jgi:exonuclease III
MTNSKMKPDSLKLLSLNVRGLGNFRKRRAIFTWCRKQKADLIFLQETHTKKNCESQWKKKLVFFHYVFSWECGASGLGIVIQHEHSDSKAG